MNFQKQLVLSTSGELMLRFKDEGEMEEVRKNNPMLQQCPIVCAGGYMNAINLGFIDAIDKLVNVRQ